MLYLGCAPLCSTMKLTTPSDKGCIVDYGAIVTMG